MEYRNDMDSLMAVCAFRYCLGRMTYVVKDCVDWLIVRWDDLTETDQKLIIKETRESLSKGQAGMKMDQDEWYRLLDHVVGGH